MIDLGKKMKQTKVKDVRAETIIWSKKEVVAFLTGTRDAVSILESNLLK